MRRRAASTSARGCSRRATSPGWSRKAASRRSPKPSAAPTRPPTRKSAAARRSTASRACRSTGRSIPIAAARTPVTTASRGAIRRSSSSESDDEFASLIFVKINFVEVLRKELDHPRWTREHGRARHRDRSVSADRRALQAVARHARGARRRPHAGRHRHQGADGRPRHRRPAGAEQGRRRDGVHQRADVSTKTSWRTLEPGTAHPLQRLRAVQALVDAGIDAGVLMAPLVPGFSTAPAKIEATVKAIADHGARFVGSQSRCSSTAARAITSCASSQQRVPRAGRSVRSAVRVEVRAEGLLGHGCRRRSGC